jgi:Fe-S cluster biogenesis protein NfuA
VGHDGGPALHSFGSLEEPMVPGAVVWVEMNDLYDRVDKALDEIRPYIHSHAGDVNLVDVSDEGIVKLQMVGSCDSCPMSMITLRLGIERILKEKVPGIKDVLSIRPDEFDFDFDLPEDDDARKS